MGIHEGHRDRMKQEFLQGGLAHVSEPRVLELLLFYSRPPGGCEPPGPPAAGHLRFPGGGAGRLPRRPAQGSRRGGKHGGPPQADPRHRCPVPGLPHQRGGDPLDSATLHALFTPPTSLGPGTRSPSLACFDSKGKLLGVRPLSEGTPNANEISLRKITTEALALNATVVVLAHNHPSGLATPSQEDLFLTRYIKIPQAPRHHPLRPRHPHR